MYVMYFNCKSIETKNSFHFRSSRSLRHDKHGLSVTDRPVLIDLYVFTVREIAAVAYYEQVLNQQSSHPYVIAKAAPGQIAKK